jgi:hypothetical protein
MKQIFLVLIVAGFVAGGSGLLMAQTGDVKSGKSSDKGGTPQAGSSTISVQLAGEKAKPPQKVDPQSQPCSKGSYQVQLRPGQYTARCQ